MSLVLWYNLGLLVGLLLAIPVILWSDKRVRSTGNVSSIASLSPEFLEAERKLKASNANAAQSVANMKTAGDQFRQSINERRGL